MMDNEITKDEADAAVGSRVDPLVSWPPVHERFRLSYASWFVAPRVVLEAMPHEWQKKFIAVIDELDSTFDWEARGPHLGVFQVDDDCNNPERPPRHLNDYRHPDKEWLDSIKSS